MGYAHVHRSFGKPTRLETFSKNLLIGLNTIFVVFGFILFVYGCGGKTSTNRGAYVGITAEGGDLYQMTSNILIIVGVVSVLIGLWGLCGIHSYLKALIYVVLLLLLAFADIAFGIYSTSMESRAKVSVEHNLISSLQKLKNGTPSASEGEIDIINAFTATRDSWDALQTELKCCGIYEYRDWYLPTLPQSVVSSDSDNNLNSSNSYSSSSLVSPEFAGNHYENSEAFMRIPHSCFKNGDDGMVEADFNNPVSPDLILENIYGDGCLDKAVVDLDIGRMQRVGVLLAVVKLLAVMCAFVVTCYLNNEKAAQSYYV